MSEKITTIYEFIGKKYFQTNNDKKCTVKFLFMLFILIYIIKLIIGI